MNLLKIFLLLSIFSSSVCLASAGKTPESQIITWLLSTFFILAIIFVLAYLLKKTRIVKNSVGKLAVENSLYIGPKQKILLVRAGDRRILVGVTPNSINYMCDYSDEKTEFSKILNNSTDIKEKSNDESK